MSGITLLMLKLYRKCIMTQPPRLLERVRQVVRLKHFSPKTEKSYLYYIKDFILFHHKRHPREMGVTEIRAYLSHLATEKNVAASTQNVALSALLFLYRQVLEIELPYITVQELLGHKDVKTTMIYTHVLNRGGRGVRSPLDP